MVIAGFWHGAAYTFIIWGAMHGTALVLERILGFQDLSKKPAWLKFFWFLVVQLTVLIAWIFFRARGLDQAGELVGNLFTNRWGLESIGPLSPGLVFVLPILLMHTRGFLADKKWVSSPKPLEQAVWCAIMFYCLLSFYGNNSEFIYFKF
jgi:alginate O-acetyltransferase complex protein AlgI